MDVVIAMLTVDAETLAAQREAAMPVPDGMSPLCSANGCQSPIGRASRGATITPPLGRAICIGSGAAGDFLAATVTAAPTSMRSIGCELLRGWLMRRGGHRVDIVFFAAKSVVTPTADTILSSCRRGLDEQA